MWVESFKPHPLYPQGRSPCYPLDRRLGGSQSRSRRGGEEKNSQLLPGFEPPIIQSIAQRYTMELFRHRNMELFSLSPQYNDDGFDNWIRDNSVIIVTKLQAGQPECESRQGRGHSLRHRVQTDYFGTHPASSPMGTGSCFPKGRSGTINIYETFWRNIRYDYMQFEFLIPFTIQRGTHDGGERCLQAFGWEARS
jgi:hypothetical protein